MEEGDGGVGSRVSYIFPPPENHNRNGPHHRLLSLIGISKNGNNHLRWKKCMQVSAISFLLIISLLCFICWSTGSVWGHLWGGFGKDGSRGLGKGGTWEGAKMERLQPVLLEQVRALLLTANRSIHDPVSRQLLRNLSKEDNSTCYTPNCLHTGLSLLEAMNFSVDPCQDFYEFACGSWTTHSIGDPAPSLPFVVNSDQFSKINEKVIKATQKILEDTTLETESQTIFEAKKLYSQCKDLYQLEKDGLSSLWGLIDSYGGWPLLGPHFEWNKTMDWLVLAGDLQRLSSSSILSLDVKQHPVNPLQNVIYMVQPKFFLSREYLINPAKYPKIFAAYKEFIMALAAELNNFGNKGGLGQDNPEKLSQDVDNLIKFESSLAKLSSDDTDPGKPTRKAQYPVHKLQRESDLLTPRTPKYPTRINWLKFLRQVFRTSGVNITEEEKLVIHDVSYIRGLSSLLSTTPPSTLANYLIWRLAVTFTTGTTHHLRKLNFNFYSIVYGMKRIPPRSSTCATVVKDAFALAIGMRIVRGLTDISSKKEVEGMVENVRVGMEKLLNQKHLGPAMFPIGISRKLNTLKHCIGYPSSFQNTSGIDNFYKSLKFNEDDEIYLKKYVSLRFWLYDKTLTTLREPFDSDCWSGTSWANIGEAYAYYDTARNTINFPIGLLQAPFYMHNVPFSVNYGAIGAIIGHEISHSINIEGWIKVGLVQKLEDYWECLLHHYSAYEVPSLGPDSRVNGLRTRSENLADHLGLAAAYLAYQQMYDGNSSKTPKPPPQQRIVGLDIFTPNQMFFLSFAHMWCVNGPDEWLADELESSSHTPGRYRVLGSLQNSEQFANSWKCPLGSEMNPLEKCNSIITDLS